MATAESEINITIRLTLTYNEAGYLKDVLQNNLLGGEELPERRVYRESIFKAIAAALDKTELTQ